MGASKIIEKKLGLRLFFLKKHKGARNILEQKNNNHFLKRAIAVFEPWPYE
jgi:hypothetical protein